MAKIKHEILPHDILCSSYITPTTSTSASARENIWQLLTSEVAKFSSQGDILLTCDFNARTGVLSDYSEHDSHKYISLPLNYKPDSSQMRCNSEYLWERTVFLYKHLCTAKDSHSNLC